MLRMDVVNHSEQAASSLFLEGHFSDVSPVSMQVGPPGTCHMIYSPWPCGHSIATASCSPASCGGRQPILLIHVSALSCSSSQKPRLAKTASILSNLCSMNFNVAAMVLALRLVSVISEIMSMALVSPLIIMQP
mmetsp:Transcript_67197/g.160983  ORF Transcript_67197/g.160983 Transcript_67197/m.160983 type:complete len:134 (+) Transcript_67197:66-467(+)